MHILKGFRNGFYLSSLLLTALLHSVQAADSILLQRTANPLGPEYVAASSFHLGGNLVALLGLPGRTQSRTYFDASSGVLIAGDIADPEGNRLIDYVPATGLSILLDKGGTLNLAASPDSEALTSLQDDPAATDWQALFVGSRLEHLLLISTNRLQNTTLVRKLVASTMEEIWRVAFDSLPRIDISEDRSHFLASLASESGFATQMLNYYAVANGGLVSSSNVESLNLTARTIAGKSGPPDGSFSYYYDFQAPALHQVDHLTGQLSTHARAITLNATSSFSVNRDYYVALSGSGWEVRSTANGAVLRSFGQALDAAPAFSASGTSVYIHERDDSLIQEIEIATGATARSFPLLENDGDAPTLVVSADGTRLAALYDNGLSYYDLPSPTPIHVAVPISKPNLGLFTANSQALLVGGLRGAFFSVKLGAQPEVHTLSPGAIATASYSPPKDQVVAVRKSGVVEAFDPQSLTATRLGQIPIGTPLSVSADSLRILSMVNDEFIVYDLNTESIILRQSAPPRQYNTPAVLSPSGSFLLLGASTGGPFDSVFEQQIIDIDQASTVATFDSPAAFTPDETTLVVHETSETKSSFRILNAADLSLKSESPPLSKLSHFAITNDSKSIIEASKSWIRKISTADGSVEFDEHIPAAASNGSLKSLTLSQAGDLALLKTTDGLAILYDLEKQEIATEAQLEWTQSNVFITQIPAKPQPLFLPGGRQLIDIGQHGNVWTLLKPQAVEASLNSSSQGLTLDFAYNSSLTHLVESSSDLEEWSDLQRIEPEHGKPSGPLQIQLESAAKRFYRVWKYE